MILLSYYYYVCGCCRSEQKGVLIAGVPPLPRPSHPSSPFPIHFMPATQALLIYL